VIFGLFFLCGILVISLTCLFLALSVINLVAWNVTNDVTLTAVFGLYRTLIPLLTCRYYTLSEFTASALFTFGFQGSCWIFEVRRLLHSWPEEVFRWIVSRSLMTLGTTQSRLADSSMVMTSSRLSWGKDKMNRLIHLYLGCRLNPVFKPQLPVGSETSECRRLSRFIRCRLPYPLSWHIYYLMRSMFSLLYSRDINSVICGAVDANTFIGICVVEG